MQAYSTRLYAELGKRTGSPIDYHVTGSLRLAHGRERIDEFHRVAAMARARGLAFEVVSPSEARKRYPFLELHDLAGALWDPGDGDIDPSQLTQAYAKGARDAGARIRRFTKVTGLARAANGEWRVTTDKGDIVCETVVNAAGYRAGEIMALVGRRLPVVALSHQYLVTEAIPALAARGERLPLLRDPDASYYLRQERDGLLLGPYEADARVHWLDGIPDDFANQLWPDDLDRLETYIADAVARVPVLGTVGVRRVINGPIPYAPDGNPLIGPVRGLPGFFQCCAFTFGIAQSGGAGFVAAEWIVEGAPPWDIWPCDALRFGDYATTAYTVERATELYRREYAIAFPADEWPGGRPALQTPLYPVLEAKGRAFAPAAGGSGSRGSRDLPMTRTHRRRFGAAGWHEAVGEESRAVREAVGIMDMGGFTKLVVEGAGAAAFLDRMLCGRLPETGRIRLTWALDAARPDCQRIHGHPARVGAFLPGERGIRPNDHDLHWLERALPANGSVRIEDWSGVSWNAGHRRTALA